MTINIITPNGSGDSLVYTCPRTAIAAEVTGSEVSSGEGKLEFKTTTGGTSTTRLTIDEDGAATFTGATTTAGTVTASGDMKFNSGYGSAVVVYGCRAWVNFNGTGTVAIRESGNVSSITDNDTGNYTVNFTTTMVDANYSAHCSVNYPSTGSAEAMIRQGTTYGTPTTSAISLNTGYAYSTGQAMADQQGVFVAIFR
jgi:hypothetical protein